MHASPVFTDPSGRRRRKMRLLGIGAGAVIAASLVLITVGLAGGPKAPFIAWAIPHGAPPGQHPAAAGHKSRGQARPSASTAGAPSPSADSQPSPSADPQPSPRPSPRPSASSSPSPSTSTGSPTPTNPSGRTPPAQGHTKTPNPHKSTHGP